MIGLHTAITGAEGRSVWKTNAAVSWLPICAKLFTTTDEQLRRKAMVRYLPLQQVLAWLCVPNMITEASPSLVKAKRQRRERRDVSPNENR